MEFDKTKLVIRPIDEYDESVLQELIHLEEEAFGYGGLHNEWLMVPMLKYGKIYVALFEERIIGSAQFMQYWRNIEKVYFYGTSVLTEFRGKGLGTYFLKHAFDDLRKQNFKSVILSVKPENKNAIHVYESKLGFKEVKYSKNEYGSGEDRLIMECNL